MHPFFGAVRTESLLFPGVLTLEVLVSFLSTGPVHQIMPKIKSLRCSVPEKRSNCNTKRFCLEFPISSFIVPQGVVCGFFGSRGEVVKPLLNAFHFLSVLYVREENSSCVANANTPSIILCFKGCLEAPIVIDTPIFTPWFRYLAVCQ